MRIKFQPGNYLYIFLDEGGNFNFSPTGAKYFTLTSVSLLKPSVFDQPLSEYKYKLLTSSVNTEQFHASEDKQYIRDKVFDIITHELPDNSIDNIVVQKNKTIWVSA